jgi:hypothetical membrane protein
MLTARLAVIRLCISMVTRTKKQIPKKYRRLAYVLYAVCIQYYIVQVIVASKFTLGYSLKQNTISDLGNSFCGQYGSRYVCSPLCMLMNVSFIFLGLLMITGSLLIYMYDTRIMQRIACACMICAGIGTVLVGVFPENTIPDFHIVGAALPFVLGNLSLILFGLVKSIRTWIRRLAYVLGVIGLLALCLFMTHNYGDLGIGGMERLVAYPQTIWLIIFGFDHLLRRGRVTKVNV